MNARLHELVCVFIFAEIKMYTIGLHEHFMYCVQYNKNRFGDLPWNQANAYPVNNIESKTREPTKTQYMLNTTYSPSIYYDCSYKIRVNVSVSQIIYNN